ncbi:MAG: hypothetical protein AAFQ07_00845 [Chloroflexota bacterium]
MSDATQQPNDHDEQQDTSQLQRVFKIGNNLIVEDERLMGLSNEEAQQMLSFAYPEVANANMTTSVQNGQLIVEWLVRPGRKG